MSSENLRREGRVEAKIQVVIVRGRRTIELETSDVSFKGLFLRTDEPPPVRSLVRLRVKLPHGDIEAHAMAVHVKDRGVGVQFWGLAGPDRLAWDGFIQQLLQAKRGATKKETAPISENVPVSADAPPKAGRAPLGGLADVDESGTPSGIRIAPIVDLDASREVGDPPNAGAAPLRGIADVG